MIAQHMRVTLWERRMTSEDRGEWGLEVEYSTEIQTLINEMKTSVSAIDENVQNNAFSKNLDHLSKLSLYRLLHRGVAIRPFDLHACVAQTVEDWRKENGKNCPQVSLTFGIEVGTKTRLVRHLLVKVLKLLLDERIKQNLKVAQSVVVNIDHDKVLNFHFRPNSTGMSEELVAWNEGTTASSDSSSELERAVLQLGAVVTRSANGNLTLKFDKTRWGDEDSGVSHPAGFREFVAIRTSSGNLVHELTDVFGEHELGLVPIFDEDRVVDVLNSFYFAAVLLDVAPSSEDCAALSARLRSELDVGPQLPIVALAHGDDLCQNEFLETLDLDRVLNLASGDIQSIGDDVRKMIAKNSNMVGANSNDPSVNGVKSQLVIDAEVLGSLRGAVGPEVFDELLTKLHADLMVVRSELKGARHGLDLFQIRRSTHVLISLAGSFGATELQMLAQKLNILANQEKHGEVSDILTVCLQGLELFITFVVEEQAL